jgi:hypothetical protein
MKKLFIIFAILCLAAPAMAADWNFYGSARFATYYNSNDFGPEGAQADDQDLTWAQQGNSRIGANVKFNDQIGGRFEMSDSFGKRMLFGTYTFGNGSELLIGQTYTPTGSYFYSNSVYADDGDLFGMGQFYAGRQEMIQWKMGGFKVALVNPSPSGTAIAGDNDDAGFVTVDPVTGAVTPANKDADNAIQVTDATGAFEVEDADVILPKIEASYQFKTDTFFIDVFGGYQTYDLDAGTKDYSIDSYVLGVGGGINFGALYLNLGVHMGQNYGNYGHLGWLQPLNQSADNLDTVDDANIGFAAYDAAADDIKDNDALGYLAVLGFNASEMFTIEAGYGHQEYEPDVAGAGKDKADQYYLNCVINIAPGFFIVPEVGMVDWEVQDTDLGDFTYFGAKWQINF